MEKDLNSIKKLLIIIVIPLIMYVLNILSFILIPLVFGLFFALLFTPMIRWMQSKKIPNSIGVLSVFMIVVLFFLVTYKIVERTTTELSNIDTQFIETFDARLNQIVEPIVNIMKIEPEVGESNLSALLNNEKVVANLFENLGSGINIARGFFTTLLMSIFFMVLFLVGSINIEDILETFVFKQKEASAKAYRQIEKDVFAFISVKSLMSFITGLGVSIICYSFGVKFPVFWGVAAFMLNFIQLVGSIILVGAVLLFALVELSFTGTFIFFTTLLIGLQVIIGSILEPVMMGKSFSINTITIIVMLSIWGLIWGIPGFVLSVPITALIKKIMEYFPKTKVYADIMS